MGKELSTQGMHNCESKNKPKIRSAPKLLYAAIPIALESGPMSETGTKETKPKSERDVCKVGLSGNLRKLTYYRPFLNLNRPDPAVREP